MSSRLRPGRRKRAEAPSTSGQPLNENTEAVQDGIINWGKLKKIRSETLTAADELFIKDMLKIQFTESEIEAINIKQTTLLLNVLKTFARNKLEKVTETERETEKWISKFRTTEQELLKELHQLENERDEIQQATVAQAGSGRELILLISEKKELQRKIQSLELRLRETEKQSNDYQEINNRLQEDLTFSQDRITELKLECDRLHSDVREYQQQLQTQGNSLQLKHHGSDIEIKEKMRTRNRELSQALDENNRLRNENLELTEIIRKLTKQEEQYVQEMDKTTIKINNFKESILNTNALLDKAAKERDYYKLKVEELLQFSNKKSDLENEVMKAVSLRAKEWQDEINKKDGEVLKSETVIKELREQLTAYQMDTDRASVTALTQALVEKDQQIHTMQKEITVMTEELNAVAAQMEDLKEERGSAFQVKHIDQINILQKTNKELERNLKLEQERSRKAEEEAYEKDKQLNDALSRMLQYETGEYGLTDAVKEIKDCKQQIRLRDADIQTLTQDVNKLMMEINDINDENEELRSRIGLSPREYVNVEEIMKRKANQRDQEKALNRVLTGEIERLEEERIQLKKRLRLQAMQAMQKQNSLEGYEVNKLLPDELLPSEKSAEIAAKSFNDSTTERNQGQLDLTSKCSQQQQELITNGLLIKELKSKTINYTSQIKKLEEDCEILLTALKELLQIIRSNKHSEEILNHDSVPQILKLLESNNLKDSRDLDSKFQQLQIAHLNGHVEELRTQAEKIHAQNRSLTMQCDRLKLKYTNLEKDYASLMEEVPSNKQRTKLFPEGLSRSSTSLIGTLSEYLLILLQELSLCQGREETLRIRLDNFKRIIQLHKEKQKTLYKLHLDEKRSYKTVVDQMKIELELAERKLKTAEVEFNSLQKIVNELHEGSSDKTIIQQQREILKLRINEENNLRNISVLEKQFENEAKQIETLRRESTLYEKFTLDRISYLQRYKERAKYKIKRLTDYCSSDNHIEDYELLSRQYSELMNKYRHLLQKDITRKRLEEAIAEVNANIGYKQNEEMRRLIYIQRQQINENAHILDSLIADGLLSKAEFVQMKESVETYNVTTKLTSVENKLQTETQRSDFLDAQNRKLKQMVDLLEKRNCNLEQELEEVSQLNLKLRINIESSEKDALNLNEPLPGNREKVESIELAECKLKDEIIRLRNEVEIANNQTECMKTLYTASQADLSSLQKQLRDGIQFSDDKALIAKLYHQLSTVQLSDAVTNKKLETMQQRISKSEGKILVLEKSLDDKDDDMKKNAGSVSMQKLEQLHETLDSTIQEKVTFRKQLQNELEANKQLEEKIEELNIKCSLLPEIGSNDRAFDKVNKLNNIITELRLNEFKQTRVLDVLQKKDAYQCKLLEDNEKQLVKMGEEKAELQNKLQYVWLEYEDREIALENKIQSLESRIESSNEAAVHMHEESAILKIDRSKPISEQLDLALRQSKNYITIILQLKSQLKSQKKEFDTLTKDMKACNEKLLQKEQELNEIRLQFPSNYRTSNSRSGNKNDKELDIQQNSEINPAIETISALQTLLKQKDITIEKYKNKLKMIREGRENNSSISHTDSNPQENFKSPLNLQFDPEKPFTSDQKQEDTILQQEDSLKRMSERLSTALNELSNLKVEMNQSRAAFEKKIKDTQKDYEMKISELEEILQRKDVALRSRIQEIELLKGEVSRLKAMDASQKAKDMIDKLRKEIITKEKQLKSLSKALMELKHELVTSSENDAKSSPVESTNVQQLIERETMPLKEQIEDKNKKIIHYKKLLNDKQETEVLLNSELRKYLEQCKSKDSMIERLRKHGQIKADFKTKQKKSDQDESPDAVGTLRSNFVSETDAAVLKKNRDYWEDNKNLQKRVDKLKLKLDEKDFELKAVIKRNEMLTEAFNRINRERSVKLSSKDQNKEISLLRTTQPNNSAFTPEPNENSNKAINSMKRIIQKLQSENAFLRTRLENHEITSTTTNISSPTVSPKKLENSSSVAKIVGENNSLRVDKKKLQEKCTRLSVEIGRLNVEREELQNDLKRIKTRLFDQNNFGRSGTKNA
ncbi:Centrosomal protein of 290 kDa [Trichoplax sp. H2]|nr:Centrosomal protein of 290 kDa [Trichoplax sp. H2]|eukprot:RDD38835.1 Centrosomal protein of 290 kDa [Trichoplax sp. H2]